VRDRHLFDVYVDAAESSRAVIRKHRARQRHLLDRIVDEGIATGIFDPRDRDRAVAFVTDGAFRFINPVAVRLDAEMPEPLFAARLSAAIHAIQRVLTAGVL
jgi:hypothetical protein